MCYHDFRWHTICNHTIQARVECPKKCAKYGAIDRVETQLAAYCQTCRSNVDSLGIDTQQQQLNDSHPFVSSIGLSSRRRGRKHVPEPLKSSASVQGLRLRAVTSPTAPSLETGSRAAFSNTGTGSSPVRRLESAVSMGDLRGEMTGGRRAGHRSAVSVFMQELLEVQKAAQEAAQERAVEEVRMFMKESDSVPELKSPVPKETVLSLRNFERSMSQSSCPTPSTANTLTTNGTSSSQATLSLEVNETAKSTRTKANSPVASTALATPKTPESLSNSLQRRPSIPSRQTLRIFPPSPKATMAPTTPAPSTEDPTASRFSSTRIDLRKGLRKAKSSSRLLGAKQHYFMQHKHAPQWPRINSMVPSLSSPTS